ncbi:MAG: aminopeptidase P N-terminal domain-containing protein, partial [Vicinamibacteria bacterium]
MARLLMLSISTISMISVILSLGFGSRTAFAGELQEDLRARRARVMEQLGPHSMLILWSADLKNYSNDVEYEFRQDSNLYYLTAMEQDETILVLMPGNETREEILFIKKKDPMREHREGHIMSKKDATEHTSIEAAYLVDRFDAFVSAMLTGRPFDLPRYRASTEYSAFFEALADNRAQVALVLTELPELEGELSYPLRFAQQIRERYFGFEVQDAADIIHKLRQIKTPYEQKLLRRSGVVASEGHLAGMRAALSAQYEYEVEAVMEATYLRLGAYGSSYPAIVASGPNATILHYSTSRRKMEPGDLLLVDSAANYQYQTVDITRTYPVSGTFDLLQKDIYHIVLAAQDAGMEAAVAGSTLNDVHLATVEVVKQALLTLGLITDTSGDQYRTWYTHGACHWIGMDVHDVGERDRPLEPGMAFV